MRTNARACRPRTHEGAPAALLSPEQRLRRSLLSCLLWEDTFYEDGQEIAARIRETARGCKTDVLAALAREARHEHGLRHAPLLLLLELVRRGGKGVAAVIADVIRRPDEITELLALYWQKGRRPLPAQLKKGLAQAFLRFDAYQLAKYDRRAPVRLRDAMFLVHPRPGNAEQAEAFRRLASGTLPSPDTWEVALSAGNAPRETWERLLKARRLGYLALLRNLRNMEHAGVDPALVEDAIRAYRGAAGVLPFQFVLAAWQAPRHERALNDALLKTLEQWPRFSGRTFVLVDVSLSMTHRLSRRGHMTRMMAAAALAGMVRAESVRLFTFSDRLVEVPAREGLAAIDAILRAQEHAGTYLGRAMRELNARPHDRLIVFTDEQCSDAVPPPAAPRAYMINLAPHARGVGYGRRWVHVDGFSAATLRYIHALEAAQNRP
jgi:hypothetical protein